GSWVREPCQVAVDARRVDDDEVVAVLDRGDRVGEAGELDRLVLVDAQALAAADAEVHRQLERKLRALRPRAAVADVVGEAGLARVEGDGGEAVARLSSRERDGRSAGGAC